MKNFMKNTCFTLFIALGFMLGGAQVVKGMNDIIFTNPLYPSAPPVPQGGMPRGNENDLYREAPEYNVPYEDVKKMEEKEKKLYEQVEDEQSVEYLLQNETQKQPPTAISSHNKGPDKIKMFFGVFAALLTTHIAAQIVVHNELVKKTCFALQNAAWFKKITANCVGRYCSTAATKTLVGIEGWLRQAWWFNFLKQDKSLFAYEIGAVGLSLLALRARMARA